MLSHDQRRAVRLAADDGESIFFTGCAGTGKSFTLQAMIEALARRKRRVAVTATTGPAAVVVKGNTLHSWAGIGRGEDSVEKYVQQIRGWPEKFANWTETDVLVIDECSMLSTTLFEKLEAMARRLRERPDLPFGGLQLVMTGDFAQLPPIERTNDSGEPRYLFESAAFKRCIPMGPRNIVLLRQVFRQRGDREFLELLDEVRVGVVSQRTAQLLKQAATRDLRRGDDRGVAPTRLFAGNRKVDEINERHLRALPPQHVPPARFESSDWGRRDELSGCLWPRTLELKVGSQVMLLKNVDVARGLVNGSRGVVVGITQPGEDGDEDADEDGDEDGDEEEEGGGRGRGSKQSKHGGEPLVEVQFRDGPLESIERATHEVTTTATAMMPVPAALAAASAARAGRVAAATAKVPAATVKVPPPPVAATTAADAATAVAKATAAGGSPLDEALDALALSDDGDDDAQAAAAAAAAAAEAFGSGAVIASRKQFPLKLAWAMTIHKSQGQTCHCLEVDLGFCPNHGQAYTALSRATSLANLRVINFNRKSIHASPKVVQFLKELEALEPNNEGAATAAATAAGEAASATADAVSSCPAVTVGRASSAPRRQALTPLQPSLLPLPPPPPPPSSSAGAAAAAAAMATTTPRATPTKAQLERSRRNRAAAQRKLELKKAQAQQQQAIAQAQRCLTFDGASQSQ